MLISSVECSQNMKVDTNAVVTKKENTKIRKIEIFLAILKDCGFRHILVPLFVVTRVIFYNQQNEGTSRRRRSPVAIKTYPRKSFRNPYKSSVILNV